jgi:hypothetical protein
VHVTSGKPLPAFTVGVVLTHIFMCAGTHTDNMGINDIHTICVGPLTENKIHKQDIFYKDFTPIISRVQTWTKIRLGLFHNARTSSI